MDRPTAWSKLVTGKSAEQLSLLYCAHTSRLSSLHVSSGLPLWLLMWERGKKGEEEEVVVEVAKFQERKNGYFLLGKICWRQNVHEHNIIISKSNCM